MTVVCGRRTLNVETQRLGPGLREPGSEHWHWQADCGRGLPLPVKLEAWLTPGPVTVRGLHFEGLQRPLLSGPSLPCRRPSRARLLLTTSQCHGLGERRDAGPGFAALRRRGNILQPRSSSP